MSYAYHGRWGGWGFSDGRHTVLTDELIDLEGQYDDLVDLEFREHDHAYFNAEKAYSLSAKTSADRAQRAQLAAMQMLHWLI